MEDLPLKLRVLLHVCSSTTDRLPTRAMAKRKSRGDPKAAPAKKTKDGDRANAEILAGMPHIARVTAWLLGANLNQYTEPLFPSRFYVSLPVSGDASIIVLLSPSLIRFRQNVMPAGGPDGYFAKKYPNEAELLLSFLTMILIWSLPGCQDGLCEVHG